MDNTMLAKDERIVSMIIAALQAGAIARTEYEGVTGEESKGAFLNNLVNLTVDVIGNLAVGLTGNKESATRLVSVIGEALVEEGVSQIDENYAQFTDNNSFCKDVSASYVSARQNINVEVATKLLIEQALRMEGSTVKGEQAVAMIGAHLAFLSLVISESVDGDAAIGSLMAVLFSCIEPAMYEAGLALTEGGE